MAWTKDSESEAPKVIYTPNSIKENGITRLVYDPKADASKRWTMELTHITNPSETVAQAEAALDVS